MAPAPASTGFFRPDPGAGAVLARYAANRDVAATGESAARAATRLTSSRWDRVARRRQLVGWGRDDAEYEAKKDFEAVRGDYLRDVARIHTDTEDYPRAKAALYAKAPPAARDDPGAIAMWTSMDREHQNWLMQTRSEQADESRREE